MSYYSAGMHGPGAMPYGAAPKPAPGIGHRLAGFSRAVFGVGLMLVSVAVALSLASWSQTDPSLTHAASGQTRNWLGPIGAIASDLLIQMLGLAGILVLLPIAFWGLQLATSRVIGGMRLKLILTPLAIGSLAAAFSALPLVGNWPLRHGCGGIVGDFALSLLTNLFASINPTRARAGAGLVYFAIGLSLMIRALGMTRSDLKLLLARRRMPGAPGMWMMLTGKMTAAGSTAGAQNGVMQPGAPFSTDGQYAPNPYDPATGQMNLAPGIMGLAPGNPGAAPLVMGQPGYPNHAQPYPHAHVGPVIHRPAHQAPPQHPAQRAQVYPNPFLRAHPMTAATVAPLMSQRQQPHLSMPPAPMPRVAPQQHPAPAPTHTHVVTPIVFVPVPSAAQHYGPNPHTQSGSAHYQASNLMPNHHPAHINGMSAHQPSPHTARAAIPAPTPPPTRNHDAVIDVTLAPVTAHDTTVRSDDDRDMDSESRAIAARFAPREPAPRTSLFAKSFASLVGPIINSASKSTEATSDVAAATAAPARPQASSPNPASAPIAAPAVATPVAAAPSPAAPPPMAIPAPQHAAPTTSANASPQIEMPPTTARRVAEMMADRRRASSGSKQASPLQAPATTMLKPAPAQRLSQETSAQTLRGLTKLLLDTLNDYGVKGDITAVRPGPVVTLFEFEPARGTKSSRVIGLADDIARSMSATAVRIAVIPGRNAIGIELPNVTRETVYLRELIESDTFTTAGMKLPLALGRNIGGEPVITDLARMPHLLVAGTTGSGKSVGVNAMILSLLYRLSPAECRLIMIDPKMLELSVYNDIPHLLAPVVTEPGKAVAALNWVVREMEDRYRRMSRLAVRNIDAYNVRIRENAPTTAQAKTAQRQGDVHMPYIVVIIDEFADLMAVAGKEIEFAVQRLAQMARAAGIHLIMATQRPSVDVITGTIKANFPTRISFRVTSRIDSRTILNEHGAEQLLGQGDMLFTGGANGTMRVHGPYVSDEEVETISAWLRASGAPDYSLDFADATESDEDSPGVDLDLNSTEDDDDIYDRAVAVVVRDQKASTSYLQRRLSIGYNRAADLIERMEIDGIIGPANHAGKRELLAPGSRNSGADIDD